MAVKNVTLLGADGNLGPAVLRALVAAGLTVTVLKRASSRSPSTHPRERRVADAFDLAEVTAALAGQDALVVTIKADQVALQQRLADACVGAGVRRYVLADFGSCDSSSALTQELLPLYGAKTAVREYVQGLARAHPRRFEWTSLVCGHFFDWSPQFLHLWPQEQRADVLDDGEQRFSISTLARIGDATARVLRRWDDEGEGKGTRGLRNRIIYVQSFCVSQNQIIAAYERAMGVKWDVRRVDAKEFQRAEMEKVARGDKGAVEEIVWLLGTIDANWEAREAFAMKELDLADEDLDEVVKRIVAASASG